MSQEHEPLQKEQFVEALYRNCFPKFMTYAVSVLGHESEAQDVVQDTFLLALSKADLLMQHENPEGWLFRTLRLKIKEYQRSRKRLLNRCLSWNALLDEHDGGDNLKVDFQEPQDERYIEKELEQNLTKEEYRLLKRVVFDRVGHLQASREFGISVYACQKRLERIRKKLERVFPDRRHGEKKKK